MTLYHFTARRFVARILTEGLTMGSIPISVDPPRVRPGYQWLTRNPEFAQTWAVGTGRLPYQRNEVRFTIEIPESEKYRLMGRYGWSLLTPLAEDLCSYGDPDNWLVFQGDIPAAWISASVTLSARQVREKSYR